MQYASLIANANSDSAAAPAVFDERAVLSRTETGPVTAGSNAVAATTMPTHPTRSSSYVRTSSAESGGALARRRRAQLSGHIGALDSIGRRGSSGSDAHSALELMEGGGSEGGGAEMNEVEDENSKERERKPLMRRVWKYLKETWTGVITGSGRERWTDYAVKFVDH